MTDLHAACVGCLEVIPMAPGQVVQVAMILLGLLLALRPLPWLSPVTTADGQRLDRIADSPAATRAGWTGP